jgi:hypothetical protein
MRRVIWAQLRTRRSLVWGAILLLVSLVLALQPLFDSLGFEFAFALGLPASLAAADLGAHVVRRARLRGALSTGVAAPARLLAEAVPATLALLVPPLVVISLNALRVRQCDWLFGVQCFLYLPACGVVLGSAAGVTCGLALAPRPRLAALAAWIVVLGSIALGLWRFYAAPPIFGYDPFAGYFPGTLYDEHLDFPAAFGWARLYQACVATLAIAGVGLVHHARGSGRVHRVGAVVAALAAAGAMTLAVQSGRLGFAVDADDIAAALGGVRETEHFVIHYPAGGAFERQIDAIAQEHELRWAQVAERLDTRPTRKIHSFYFATAADKARWMGARHTYIAKPWRHEIYVQHDDFPHATLRHEIAHVFAGEFGDPLFRVSVTWWGWPPARFNVGLIEGIAVAADWPAGQGGRLTPHQSVRAMKELGLLPPIRRLLQPGFFEFSPQQSYTTAGSFVYFLLERYGPAPVKAVYRAGGSPGSFAAAFGKPLAALEAEWHAEIDRAPITDEDIAIARERFRRRAIFARPCPHAVAERLARAERQARAGDAAGAVRTLERVCKDDPGEPSYKLILAAALERAGDPDRAARTYAELHDDDGTRTSAPLRARALWRAADLAARRGDLPGAVTLVDRALALGIDEETRRNLNIRKLAYGTDTPGTRALRAYLLPDAEPHPEPGVAPAAAADPQLDLAATLPAALGGPGHYLYGRALLLRARFAEAAPQLAAAARAGLADPLVARENDRLLAVAAFLSGDLGVARAAAQRLAAPTQPYPVQLEGEDWLERITFKETGRLR